MFDFSSCLSPMEGRVAEVCDRADECSVLHRTFRYPRLTRMCDDLGDANWERQTICLEQLLPRPFLMLRWSALEAGVDDGTVFLFRVPQSVPKAAVDAFSRLDDVGSAMFFIDERRVLNCENATHDGLKVSPNI